MLDFSDKFVCATHERAGFDFFVPSPVFRKSFTLDKLPENAELLICGLGFYDLFVNGKKLTKGLIAPYISNPDDIVYYDRYDLKSALAVGENVIGVICGNGFNNPLTRTWEFNRARHASAPKLALSFKADELEFDAASFLCTESEVFFDNMRTGAFVDARRVQSGRFLPGFDDSDWRAPLLAEPPRGYAKLCECEPVRVVEELAPISVRPGELKLAEREMLEDEALYPHGDAPGSRLPAELRAFEGRVGADCPKDECRGGYIYDFGVNNTGTFRLKLRGRAGQVIRITAAEVLDESGRADPASINIFCPPGFAQRSIYICRGEGEECFEMPFAYWGFRYLYVHGLDADQATADALTFLVAHSDVEVRAHFGCSDADANALYEIAERSDLSNFNYFPTDCPHREKNGWTGDASMSGEHMLLTLGVENSLREWLHNIRAAQAENGCLPGIVPTAGWGFKWGNGPAWDSVLFNLPWFCYVLRGNTEPIRENSHAMMSYLDYIARRRDNRGLVHIGLGDWVPTLISDDAHATRYRTPLELTDSIMVFDMARKAARMFEVIGDFLSAAFASALAKEIRTAIRENLIDFDTMTAAGATMTGQAAVIYFGILEPGECERAAHRLARMVRAADGFDCGMIGLRSIFHVLADYDEAELAYELITRRRFPSYGSVLDHGETTMTEQLISGRNPGSHNHHFLCDYKQWYIKYVGGIRVNPSRRDPDSVAISPCFIKRLDYAAADVKLPAGKVETAWKKLGEHEYELRVKFDAGIKLQLSLLPDYVIVDGVEIYDGKPLTPGEYTLKIKTAK